MKKDSVNPKSTSSLIPEFKHLHIILWFHRTKANSKWYKHSITLV